MQDTDLPYPGVINTGQQLRRECAIALSGIQISANPSGTHPAAAQLAEFFQACADYATTFTAPVIP